jgi:hypothetical protein
MTTRIPFGAIAIHKIVTAFEILFGLNSGAGHELSLSSRQRLDVGMREAGTPVILDPLIQILAAGRR